MPPEVIPVNLNRKDYLRTYGFTLVTDVNKMMMDDVAAQQPAQLSLSPNSTMPRGASESQLQKRRSRISLMMATFAVMKIIPERGDTVDNPDYNISESETDLASAQNVFQSGLGDQTFPWHFSAALASQAVDRLVYSGELPELAARNMTLTDWANIIGTGWFSNLAHSLAFARNGFYNIFGKDHTSYQHNALIKHISSWTHGLRPNIYLLEVDKQFEPLDGKDYLTVAASPALLKAVRATMQKDRSIGCPAARHATRLFPSMLTEDPHTKHLLETQRLYVKSEGEEAPDGKIGVVQEYSAIDQSLIVFAKKLDEYDTLYGTPALRRNKQGLLQVLHEHRPPVAEPYLSVAA